MKDEEEGSDVLSKINFTEEEPGMDGAPEAEPAPAEVPAEPAPAAAAPAEPAPAAAPAVPPQPVTADIWGESFTNAVNKAKKAGATAETIIRIAGQDMSLGEAITKAGMKVEDVFGNKSDELIEFVKSMYNREEGSFPKGETGVLIACEKKFGESSLAIAKKVIGKLHQISEMTRMKKLAGLPQR
jgi:pyruvate/2-oxoglutarate dehydrogenase complex dihydrolipoamide acyltransferase (E2) component